MSDEQREAEGSDSAPSRFLPRPWATMLLIAGLSGMWLWTELHGGSTQLDTLVRYGARVNYLVWSGQYWRVFTYQFLHIGLVHLAFNLFALHYLGGATEIAYGKARFLLIYFLAGLGGGLTGLFLDQRQTVAAGASGAIFGLFGALVYYSVQLPPTLRHGQLQRWLVPLLINLAYGLSSPQVDNYAHVGGFAFGLGASDAIGAPGRVAWRRLAAAVLLLASFGYGGYRYGMAAQARNPLTYLMRAQRALEDQQYDAAATDLRQALRLDPGNQVARGSLASALMHLGVEAYNRRDWVTAGEYFKQVIEARPDAAEAHYDLGLAYYQQGRVTDALAELRKVLELKPDFPGARQLLDGITGQDTGVKQ